jgi:putative SOS response-associated peptidase YedK
MSTSQSLIDQQTPCDNPNRSLPFEEAIQAVLRRSQTMCGRFELIEPERVYARFAIRNGVPPLLPNVDVRPTQLIPVVTADQQLQLMKWGLVPSWAKDPVIASRASNTINARAETVATKPSFSRPLRESRCLIPASAFFEWRGAQIHKTKYRIARCDDALFAFAGLYDVWRSPSGAKLASCTLITTTPNAVVAPIHDRMPAILLPDDEAAWLNPDRTEPAQVLPFLRPYPDELLVAVPA